MLCSEDLTKFMVFKKVGMLRVRLNILTLKIKNMAFNKNNST